jgi:lactoylglutathione lyase
MPVKSDVKITSLGYVIVYVKDIDRGVAFYRDTLGLKVKLDDSGWVEFDTGAATLALHVDPKLTGNRSPGQPIPVFCVENINQAYESLKKSGVKFDHAPRQVCEAGPNKIGMSADLIDPDGNFISIYGVVDK